MRLLAIFFLACLVGSVGIVTHLAAGGEFDLADVPLVGLTGKIAIPWVDDTTPESAEGPGADATTDTTTAPADTAADTPIAPARADDESALGAIEPAAGPPETQRVAQAETVETTATDAAERAGTAILTVPGADAARAATPDGTPPVFAMPVVCRPGVDCLVQSYVDLRAGDEARDYTCGALSYDGHRGTDIRLPSYIDMERGYPVVAAAPGVVRAARDGMPDVAFQLFGREAVTDRGLGNVVAVDHGEGWVTYYGHMRRGSIAVEEGQRVEAGQRLGLVGMSGLTEFPHLHFQVMRQGTPIDPFTSLERDAGCGIEGTNLWAEAANAAMKYPRTMLLRLGFADMVLNQPAVEYMLFKQDHVSPDSRTLVLHAYISGLLEGDRAEVRIYGPDGGVFAQAGVDIDRAQQARILRVGKKDLPDSLTPGTYRGEIRYFKAGPDGPQRLFEAEAEIIVGAPGSSG